MHFPVRVGNQQCIKGAFKVLFPAVSIIIVAGYLAYINILNHHDDRSKVKPQTWKLRLLRECAKAELVRSRLDFNTKSSLSTVFESSLQFFFQVRSLPCSIYKVSMSNKVHDWLQYGVSWGVTIDRRKCWIPYSNCTISITRNYVLSRSVKMTGERESGVNLYVCNNMNAPVRLANSFLNVVRRVWITSWWRTWIKIASSCEELKEYIARQWFCL